MCIFNTFTAKIEYVLFSTQYSEKIHSKGLSVNVTSLRL